MEKKNIQLIKKSATYKMVIPEEVERKIRFYCQEVNDIEWSGVLFFEPTGTFEDGDLTITCKDILLMDVGSATYTEFDMSPDVITYMVDNPELMDCQQGLIHSHQAFSTFFSGTDTSTLKEEGADRNCFVSLIVNNAGQYTAAITRKAECKRQIKSLITYKFFGDSEVQGTDDGTVVETVIEYFMLNIEKHEVYAPQQDMKDRLSKIKAKKAAEKRTIILNDKPFNVKDFAIGTEAPIHTYRTLSTFDLPYGNDFDRDTRALSNTKKDVKETKEDIPYGMIHADPAIINSLVCQIISCSPVTTDLDVESSVQGMDEYYKKRFDSEEYFEEWAGLFMEYLTWYTVDDSLLYNGCDDDTMQAIIAHDLQEALEELPSNIWLNKYIKELDKYIV